MPAVVLTVLVTHPMWRAECQTAQWGQAGVPQLSRGGQGSPRDPLAAAGNPQEAAWAFEGAQGVAQGLKACPKTLELAQEGAVVPAHSTSCSQLNTTSETLCLLCS